MTRRTIAPLLLLASSARVVPSAECHAVAHSRPGSSGSSDYSSRGKILVVGATGTTGLRAVQGLLDVGYRPSQLRFLTRDASRPKMRRLRELGFDLREADLQNPSSLRDVGRGCGGGCYVHATGGDTKELDASEVSSAQNLRDTLHDDVRSVVYNSAAGAADHGVRRIQQKHDVEGVLSSSEDNGGFPLRVTSLRANIFGEELWKGYTRPQILEGRYPLPVHRWRKIYLTSVRDMGRLAGTILSEEEDKDPSAPGLRVINVAGARLSGPQIARAFGRAQASRCRHVHNREMTKMAKESFHDLYEQIRFLQTSKEKTDVAALRKRFPGLISTFGEFLEETRWGDRDRTFGDLSDPESLAFPRFDEGVFQSA